MQWPFAGALAFVAVLLSILAPLVWRPETITELMRESGPVENATVVWHFAALVAIWLVDPSAFDRKSAAAASVVLIACVAKEISLRRRLLAAANFRPEPFTPTAWPNLVMAVLSLALLVAVAWLLWRYARAVLRGSPRDKPFLFTLAVAVACLLVSQLLDYLLKLDSRLGLAMSPGARAVTLSLEEVLEMMVPVLVVMAALQVGVRRPSLLRRRWGDGRKG